MDTQYFGITLMAYHGELVTVLQVTLGTDSLYHTVCNLFPIVLDLFFQLLSWINICYSCSHNTRRRGQMGGEREARWRRTLVLTVQF